ncbi:insertion element IS630 putative 39 kDa -like protein [Labeo rohita]|uniref:Insertion element IS630 putative 39 kDa-like protein n=1 Tax=Labeo rohita TaxID=84645 RepID=A0A498MVE2_LABRO|nr:insertion element IS630 putative 39 kDa -like protein [Labeo rohita]
MKQLYKVSFERNSQRNKELRQAYVDGVLEMDAHAIPHEFIFIDEAGFNLAKTRRRGRNVIGHRVIIDVPGQHGGNITMCAAISCMHGVLHRHANLGPYNTAHILTFLDRLHNILIPPEQEFFSAWRWKVYDRQPFVRMPLVQAMEEACDEIDVGAIQGWIRHSRRFFPRCLAREDIACDVDEALWPDPAVQQDAA